MKTLRRWGMRTLGPAAVFVLLALTLLPAPTSGNHVDPVHIDYNAECSDLAPQGSFWYEFKVTSVEDGTYSSGPLTVTLDVEREDDRTTIDWSSSLGIDGVFVKGGPGGNFYRHEPPASADSALSAPVNPNNDSYFEPNHLLFCTTMSLATATPTIGPTATAPGSATPSPTPTIMSGPFSRMYLPLVCIGCLASLGEPNNNCTSAYPIQAGTPYEFMPDDQHDWYRFDLSVAAELEVRVENFVPLDGQLAAYSGDSCESAIFLQNYGEPSLQKILFLGQQPAGTYFLYVSNDGQFTSADPYQLFVEVR